MANYINTIDASKPELWEARLQMNLRNAMVAGGVANVTTTISGTDKLHKPYFEELGVQTYTPGKDLNVSGVSSVDDSITINTFKAVTFYVDLAEETQVKYDTMSAATDSATYQIANTIDAAVFAQVSGGTTFDAGNVGGTDGSAIVITSSNVIDIFSEARAALQTANVVEENDFVAVFTPAQCAKINQFSTNAGFNFADAALNNGQVGNLMGWTVYMSNNMTRATYGGTANTYNCYMGKRGMIQLFMLASPRLIMTDAELKIGKVGKFWTGYGIGIWTKDKSRFLCAKVK